MTDTGKPGQQTWIWKGVRLVIDRELEECLEREQAAYVATLSAKAHTTEVLDRKRSEVLERGGGQI